MVVNIRTTILPLRNTPALSRLIGYLASQQRMAYNWAVDVLNHEPQLPAWTTKKTPDSLSSRCSTARSANPEQWNAPSYIHRAGYVQAHAANERFARDRADRLARIAAADAAGEQPRRSDIRPHRRTMKYRCRKKMRSLMVDTSQKLHRLCVCGRKLTGKDKKGCSACGSQQMDRRRFAMEGALSFVINTKADLPDDVRSVRFVEVGEHRPNAPFEQRRYCLHVSAGCTDPELPDLANAQLSDIIGMDDGIMNRWTTSDGQHYQFEEPYPNRNLQKIRAKLARQPKQSRRRRKIERRELERNRRREAERNRQFNAHAREIIAVNRPAAIAIEGKSVRNMMGSAKGTAENPGRNVRPKSGLNRSLQDAALSGLKFIAQNQCHKAGVHLLPVPHRWSSQTCPAPGCGERNKHWRRASRASRAVARCQSCGYPCNVDVGAAQILRNRLYCRVQEAHHGVLPWREEAPTGWREQPSRYGQQPLLSIAEVVSKPASAVMMQRELQGSVANRPDGVKRRSRRQHTAEDDETQPQLLPGFA